MNLSLKTDYSLRLLIYAASHAKEVVTVSEVAKAFSISAHHLTKVAQGLASIGLVELIRGRSGGVRLICDHDKIHLGDLVRKIEGDRKLVECFDAATNKCVISPACRLKPILAEAQNAFYEALNNHTLADLIVKPKAFKTMFTKSQTER